MSESPPEAASESIELVIAARSRDLGGFEVKRVLPAPARRLVGPFIFLDQMGPVDLARDAGLDVRPHPHIGLCTVTYLFDGEIVHRDSLGSTQPIRPGDVNWMIAGRGVVHSERSSPEGRARGGRVYGLQCWVALPRAEEEREPSFDHHPAATIPHIERAGVRLDVVAGTAFGAASPVGVVSPTLYVHARLESGARLAIEPEHEERAVYVVEGALSCDGRALGAGKLYVLRPGAVVEVECTQAARVMLLGGARIDGERHVYWNFVASSRERIERAKEDWRSGAFPKVPGDEQEFIPLPDA